MNYLNIFMIIIGALLLFLGRKIYWLSIGGVGFLLGYFLATHFLAVEQLWVHFLIALVCGLTSAFLIYYFQRFAIALAGLIVGVYMIVLLFDILRFQVSYIYWIGLAVGALLGAVLASVLFDWTLILLSSLAGAYVIVQNLPFDLQPLSSAVAFLLLLVIGIVIQSRLMHHK